MGEGQGHPSSPETPPPLDIPVPVPGAPSGNAIAWALNSCPLPTVSSLLQMAENRDPNPNFLSCLLGQAPWSSCTGSRLVVKTPSPSPHSAKAPPLSPHLKVGAWGSKLVTLQGSDQSNPITLLSGIGLRRSLQVTQSWPRRHGFLGKSSWLLESNSNQDVLLLLHVTPPTMTTF